MLMKILNTVGVISILTLQSPAFSLESEVVAFASGHQFLNQSEFSQFQTLAMESLDFRSRAYRFAQEKQIEEKDSIQLTREESDLLYDHALKYVSLRKKFYKYIIDSKNIFDGKNTAELVQNSPSQVTKFYDDTEGAVNFIQNELLYINPNDKMGREKIKSIELGLAASLMLMDNYIMGIMPFHKNKELDYLLNYDTEQRKILQKIVSSYANPSNRQTIVKAIKFFDQYLKWKNQSGSELTKEEQFVLEVIQSSTWYLMVKNNQASDGVGELFANLWANLTRTGHRTMRIVSYGLSMGFGNLVGLISSREGLLTKLSEKEREDLAAEMQPLDILMEKTPFRLTDKLIPGHYGHVAIWLGNEQQLRDLEVWEKIPSAIQEKIKNGARIVEALRPGVQINTLKHFLNIDDLLVIRDKRSTSKEYKQKLILTAVAQIGKDYDFNFDVNTHERIVCSEIAYVVFSDIKWPIERSVGRYTISPDHVVELATESDRIFEPVILYYNGKRYFKELPYSISLLLKSKVEYYSAFERFQAQR